MAEHGSRCSRCSRPAGQPYWAAKRTPAHTGLAPHLFAACSDPQVRLYALEGLDEPGAAALAAEPAAVLRMPSKVSSCTWDPHCEGMVTVGDFEGTLSQVHVCSGHQVADVDAHAGHRVWGVAHSRAMRHLVASASDDCTVKLWTGRGLAARAATLTAPSRAPVCGVDFAPVAGGAPLLAMACSDHCAYVYDLRAASQPLAVLRGHRRPVSYVRFFGEGRLATASTDGTLAHWQLPASIAGGAVSCEHAAGELEPCACEPAPSLGAQCMAGPVTLFQGHINSKLFTGLAVRPEDGLLACGSEGQDVFTYHTSWSQPLACGSVASPPVRTHAAAAAANGGAVAGSAPLAASSRDPQYVSAVAWQPKCAAEWQGGHTVLAAASSFGIIQLFTLAEGAAAAAH